MDINSYLAELDKELKGVDSIDKQNALAYYNEYLIDAETEVGKDVEFDASAVLGSPRTLAAQIRADIAMAPLAQDPFAPAPQSAAYQQAATTHDPLDQTSKGNAHDPYAQNTTDYQQSTAQSTYQPGQTYQQQAPGYQGSYSQPGQAQPQKRKSEMGVVWAVVLAILAIPVGIPLAAALVGIIIAVLATLFSLLIALFAVVISLFVAGVVSLVMGIIMMFSSPPVGLFYVGSGLVIFGFFILLAIAFVVLARLAIRGVAKLFNAIRVKLSRRERVSQ